MRTKKSKKSKTVDPVIAVMANDSGFSTAEIRKLLKSVEGLSDGLSDAGVGLYLFSKELKARRRQAAWGVRKAVVVSATKSVGRTVGKGVKVAITASLFPVNVAKKLFVSLKSKKSMVAPSAAD